MQAAYCFCKEQADSAAANANHAGGWIVKMKLLWLFYFGRMEQLGNHVPGGKKIPWMLKMGVSDRMV
ncbi:MAG: hypothetical protein U0T84_01025 [Chitinophagales bacterium]